MCSTFLPLTLNTLNRTRQFEHFIEFLDSVQATQKVYIQSDLADCQRFISDATLSAGWHTCAKDHSIVLGRNFIHLCIILVNRRMVEGNGKVCLNYFPSFGVKCEL